VSRGDPVSLGMDKDAIVCRPVSGHGQYGRPNRALKNLEPPIYNTTHVKKGSALYDLFLLLRNGFLFCVLHMGLQIVGTAPAVCQETDCMQLMHAFGKEGQDRSRWSVLFKEIRDITPLTRCQDRSCSYETKSGGSWHSSVGAQSSYVQNFTLCPG
jgi:hypothetical protein